MSAEHLTRDELLEIFREAGAILEGHFLLSSGRHSPVYLQCARVLSDPRTAGRLGAGLAGKLRGLGVAAVVAPAIGGIVIGHEVARALGVRSIFTERSGGAMTLRRGFQISPGERVAVVEDVLTTGGSVAEAAEVVRVLGGDPVAVGAIVSRGGDLSHLGVPTFWLLDLPSPSYDAPDCPLCREGAVPAVKPGSRGLS